ncbi:hypothetical protein V5799_017069, partial [Amblyomma americanum]
VESTARALTNDMTDSEGFADFTGMLLTYSAFKRLPAAERTRVPPDLGLNAEMTFFVSHCLKWCGTSKTDQRRRPAGRYWHTRSRCLVPLMNMPEFSAAFSCKAGSFMNPTSVGAGVSPNVLEAAAIEIDKPRLFFSCNDASRPAVTNLFKDALIEVMSMFAAASATIGYGDVDVVMGVFTRLASSPAIAASPDTSPLVYTNVKLIELDKGFKNFLEGVFNSIVTNDGTTEVVLKSPDYLRNHIPAAMQELSPHAVANYLGFMVLVKAAPFFPEKFSNLRQIFGKDALDRTLPDVSQTKALCLLVVQQVLPACFAKAAMKLRCMSRAGGVDQRALGSYCALPAQEEPEGGVLFKARAVRAVSARDPAAQRTTTAGFPPGVHAAVAEEAPAGPQDWAGSAGTERVSVLLCRALVEILFPRNIYEQDAALALTDETLRHLDELLSCFEKDLRVLPAGQRCPVDFRFKDLPEFSSDALFFLYYALDNCEWADTVYAEHQGTWKHARYRVNAALRHVEEFAEQFGCRDGDQMALSANMCHVLKKD